MTTSIYLDYAATSAIRPPQVIDAIASYLHDVGATPGRSGHARSLQAGRIVLRCRRLLAELLRYEGDPGRITFQLNATHALNVAIFGTVAAGDRVVRTTLDHNSVRRPVAALARIGVRADVFPVGPSGAADLDQLRRLLNGGGEPARLLVIPHASNVTGTVLPVAAMADVAHEAGVLVLVDAAQTVGHFPVDVEALGADLLAFSGHKGLAGPQGVGGLWVRDGVEVDPLFHGGTGGDSGPEVMPDAYPDHLEAGTQNAPGIAGLAAAVEWVLGLGVERRRAAEQALKARLLEGLREIEGIRILSAEGPDSLGIVTFVSDACDPGGLSRRLDREYGIAVRAGLHCAPDVHELLGTTATGAVRLSIGWATTEREIDRAVEAIRRITGSGR